MPKFFVKNDQINNGKINIIGEDAYHIKNVLRMRIDQELQICSVDTSENFNVIIESINTNAIICNIKKIIETKTESKLDVHIFQGIPKSDKMELIIQKSTELGVKEITPVIMDRCIVKVDKNDCLKKIDRWQKIAEAAAKQSGRDSIPTINSFEKISNIYSVFSNYDMVIVAYENEKKTTLKQVLKDLKKKKSCPKIAIIIGPEGGIDTEEISNMKKNKAEIVTLGTRILRTETVALSVLSNIMYEFEGDV
jgi:16S rRNA (uracil1498-N3)-methyltransferase